jgi:hypothetical protein
MSIRDHARRTGGQATVVTILFLTVLMGMAAAVLDIGSWFREDRQLQSTVDAAALAAAQQLPNIGLARQTAVNYGDKNGGGVSDSGISFENGVTANDTVAVHGERATPGFFARLFGIDSVTVDATAKARATAPGQAKWAAPIGVDYRHPLLTGGGCPCFKQPTSLDMYKVGPGAFKLLNIDGSYGGTGPGDVAAWIDGGLDKNMPLSWYYSDPGIKPNSSLIKAALDDRIGDIILLPVYRDTRAQGAGFEYEVIGWVGFRLTGYDIQGSVKATLSGSFESITWGGIQSESSNGFDFGAHVVALVA